MAKRGTEITVGEWLAEVQKQGDRTAVVVELARTMQAAAFEARDPRKLMTARDVAKAIGAAPSGVSRIMAELVADGHLYVAHEFGKAKFYAVAEGGQ